MSPQRPEAGWAPWRRAVSAAAANLPENAAYGLMALAPLGPLFGTQAMMLALLSAVMVNLIGALLGSGNLLAGPRASLAILTAAFVAAVLARLDATGIVATPWVVLLLLAIGLTGAGLLQIAFGALRLGGIVKYTPFPVRQGLTSGVGLLLIVTSLPVLLGQGFGGDIALATQEPFDGAAAVGCVALVAAWLAQRRRWPVPAVVVGLVAGAALHAVLLLDSEGIAFSRLIGAPSLELDWQLRVAQQVTDPRLLADRLLWAMVGGFAVTAAVLCSLDTLLTVSVVDGRLRRSRDVSRELMAQGAANLVGGLVGGMATSPSIARSLALLQGNEAGASSTRRRVVMAYTLALAVLAVIASPLLAWLPESAIGGVLMLQGLQMLAPSLWRTPWGLWRDRRQRHGGEWRMLAANWGVAAIVAGNAIVLGLGPAVFIGASFAVLLFVRANIRDVVRREWSASTRRSLKTRPAAATQALLAHGDCIVLLELEGSLFFGTADALRERLDQVSRRADTVILDMQQVAEVDVTAARILVELAEDWHHRGQRLVFAEWPESDARRAALQMVASSAQQSLVKFASTTDMALEQAEEALLAKLDLVPPDGGELPLRETLLGRGLCEDELALLQAELERVEFAAGERLFKLGDPGDTLFVSVRGDIGLRMPQTMRRLASFAPGVTVGEMSVLLRATRSAEAVAETDVVAWRMSATAFDRLMVEQPVLAAKVLRNFTAHLADRVRVLTGDLAQWVSRTAVGRGAKGSSPPAPWQDATEERE